MKIVLIVLQLLTLLTLIPWVAGLGLSFMAFDSPEAKKMLMLYLLVGSFMLYPVLLGTCLWKAWSLFSAGYVFWALRPLALPLLLVLFVVGGFGL